VLGRSAGSTRNLEPSVWRVVGTTGFASESRQMSRPVLWSFWAPTTILPPAATIKAVPTLAKDSAVDANNMYLLLSAPGKRQAAGSRI